MSLYLKEGLINAVEDGVKKPFDVLVSGETYFEAQYGVTTFDEILTAINGGKLVELKRVTDVDRGRFIHMNLQQVYPDFAILFCGIDADNIYVARILKSGNAWSLTTTQRIGATDAQINARTEDYRYITPKNLEYAVTSVINFETGTSEQVTFVEESDLEHYVKDTDYATNSKAGVVIPSNGILVNENGFTYGQTFKKEQYDTLANYYMINKGTLENVKESLVTSVVDKPWVKKGILTVDNVSSLIGASVDLAGCTELVVIGTYTATGSANLSTNVQTLYDSFFANASRTVFAHWKDTEWGIEPISDKFRGAKNSAYVYGNGTSVAWLNGKHISDISLVRGSTSSGIFTDCNIEIWAR